RCWTGCSRMAVACAAGARGCSPIAPTLPRCDCMRRPVANRSLSYRCCSSSTWMPPVPASAIDHRLDPRLPMDAAIPVQRQLDAYNAHDLDRFVAEYAADVEVFRPPAASPVLSGLPAFAAHYARNRFTLPDLHAEVTNRIV